MSVSESYLQYALEQLAGVRGIQSRRMFGGVALYVDSAIFAILDNDRIFFRVDDRTRPAFRARGSEAWDPMPGREKPSQGYYELPGEVLDDRELCAEWAGSAVSVALAILAERKKKAPKKAPKKAAKKKVAKKKAARKSAPKKEKPAKKPAARRRKKR